MPCVLTLCAPSLVQLRAAQGDTNFEKEWNQKFGWFTQSKECQQITTIHGEKSSMTVKPDCPALLYVLPLFSLLPRSPPTLSSHALLSVFCSLSLSSLFLARIFLCLLSLVLSCYKNVRKLAVYPSVLTGCLRCLDLSRRRAKASTCTATKCKFRGVCSRDKKGHLRGTFAVPRSREEDEGGGKGGGGAM